MSYCRAMFPSDLPVSFPERAAAVNLHPEDVSEHFILGSGHGGQRRNKRATAVQLVHHPTGIAVRCVHRRDQRQNRISAWMILLEKLEEAKLDFEKALAHQEYVETARKRRRSRKGKEKMLDEKKQRGEVKRNRGSAKR